MCGQAKFLLAQYEIFFSSTTVTLYVPNHLLNCRYSSGSRRILFRTSHISSDNHLGFAAALICHEPRKTSTIGRTKRDLVRVLSVCLPVCPPVSLSACLPASLPASLPSCLPLCLPACLPACLPLCLPPA